MSLLEQLWGLANESRWFSGRDGRPVRVDMGEALPTDDPATTLQPAFLVVGYDDGREERYLVPLLLRDGAEPADVCDHGEVLLNQLRAEAPGFERRLEIPANAPARRFTGEQSNTNIFFGTDVLAKVFRKIEPGTNVDVELHRALAGTGVVAELYGVWSADGEDLAVFLESLKDPEDGYDLACAYGKDERDFTDHARSLGEALATVHRVLAEKLPTGTVDGAALAAACRDRFTVAAAEIPALKEFAPQADAVFGTIPDGEIPAQRIHGDCHLGQVLLSEGRWRYVDFEGEPLKSLEERRLPDSPLRDVAGMLRSFDYAAAASDASPEWLKACRGAFLEGYGGVDSEADKALLAAFETDKAAYEAQYESRYRPHLLRVPLEYLASLTSEHPG